MQPKQDLIKIITPITPAGASAAAGSGSAGSSAAPISISPAYKSALHVPSSFDVSVTGIGVYICEFGWLSASSHQCNLRYNKDRTKIALDLSQASFLTQPHGVFTMDHRIGVLSFAQIDLLRCERMIKLSKLIQTLPIEHRTHTRLVMYGMFQVPHTQRTATLLCSPTLTYQMPFDPRVSSEAVLELDQIKSRLYRAQIRTIMWTADSDKKVLIYDVDFYS